MKTQKGIESIVGEQLSAVSFVMDYVEFHFNGSVVRALSNPIMNDKKKSVAFPEVGSRDAFCSLIGRNVKVVHLKENDHFKISFDDERVIEIPLDYERTKAPEAMHWIKQYGSPMEIWVT